MVKTLFELCVVYVRELVYSVRHDIENKLKIFIQQMSGEGMIDYKSIGISGFYNINSFQS